MLAWGKLLTLVASVSALTLRSPTSDAPNDSRSAWWARVVDHSAEDYYYAIGSASALPAELQQHRVGGEGRLHIFHLPDDQAPKLLALQLSSGSRRKSLSKLRRVRKGMSLSSVFPRYVSSSTYKNPLDEAGQSMEREVISEITPQLFLSFLEVVTSFESRSYWNAKASRAVQDFLDSQYKRMGLHTCRQSFGSESKVNVAAFLPGADESAGEVVLGAHYDSIPAEGPAPGAEDNGSGTAALLAIAKAVTLAGVRPKKSIWFVSFAGEEAGLYGSDAFAKAMTEEGLPEECYTEDRAQLRGKVYSQRDPIQAIIMDEVGWVSHSKGYEKETVNLESYDWTSEVMQHLTASARDHNQGQLLVVHSDNPFGSDHMSFLNRDMPAVLTINGDDEAYPNYHKTSDKIENVTPSYAAKIAKMNAGALLRMAGVVTKP